MLKQIGTVLLLITAFHLHSQTALEMPKKLDLGIKKGDASIVARFFNENLEMAIEGDENIYSARQAEFVLQKFFRAHKPKSFYINHQGGKTNTSYIIGTLSTENGSFKMILLLKKSDISVKIHQLRIENE
ncbi:hypothetical protein L21SP5_03503 [Salinivirga cyanobacteriivorans]|uniref:DUF4783 domain-containing protein n=1 Tax=Salinivirga cyanobacteriivorans TaxID=1307839 RepID=A0A0S2I4F6_9BACT|nr:DUF4783 domain-containing protein [Salinivirga cyanobacteriivorans]ALO17114.1 hypothetical protein L21SP5_03503 [Salinivirga cyanobacteriivorans]